MLLSIPTNGIGNLDAYITYVNKFPILTREEELELSTRFKFQNDFHAAQKLILHHLRFVVAISREYYGYGLQQADLIQEGTIGLMKAVKNFDPSTGYRLASYAAVWIKSTIQDFIIRNWRIVKIATTKSQRKLFNNLRSMRTDLHSIKPDEVTRIAKELNVSEEDVREMEQRFNANHVSINFDENDEDSKFIQIADENAIEPIIQIENAEQQRLLQEAFGRLSEREQEIIKARWMNDEQITFQELAERFGVSLQRIKQIEQSAMKKLKESIIGESK